MKPKFDPSAFKYTTKNQALISHINQFLSQYQPVIDEGKLEGKVKERYKHMVELHKYFDSLIDDTRWKQCDKGTEYISYTMDQEGFVCLKTSGIVPLSPIEVLFILSL